VRLGNTQNQACKRPPVVRVLLGPAGLRTGEGCVVGRGRGNDGAGLVEDQRTGPAGADVDAEEIRHFMSACRLPSRWATRIVSKTVGEQGVAHHRPPPACCGADPLLARQTGRRANVSSRSRAMAATRRSSHRM
jgi:hypothetical protein